MPRCLSRWWLWVIACALAQLLSASPARAEGGPPLPSPDAFTSVGGVEDVYGDQLLDAAQGQPVRPLLPADQAAQRVILFIGDGMGYAHLLATRHDLSGDTSPLAFERFPIEGEVMTSDAFANVTDSAAAATAMATGFKVSTGVISVARPGDGRDYNTLFECFASAGGRVGFVTNSFVTDATPAAFAAHAKSRRDYEDIARAYFTQTRPHVLMGGGGFGVSTQQAREAGYRVVEDRDGLLALDPTQTTRLAGLFGEGQMGLGGRYQPTLTEMTLAALTTLDTSPEGFLLLVENELSDAGSHGNDIGEVVRSIEQLDEAVSAAQAWAATRPDVLIIVTADHETGGLTVVSGQGAGALPRVRWSHQGHTAQNVPLYAWGRGALRFAGAHDNTELSSLIRQSAGIPRCKR
jgi:alkaline phosphatase